MLYLSLRAFGTRHFATATIERGPSWIDRRSRRVVARQEALLASPVDLLTTCMGRGLRSGAFGEWR